MTHYNTQQLALINAPIDQVVVGASAAGSGKTHTLLGRTERILSQYSTGKVLLISFTKSAAADMRARLKSVLPEVQLPRVVTGTFHAVLANIIRNEAVRVGLNPNFSIMDEHSSNLMVQRLLSRDPFYQDILQDWFIRPDHPKVTATDYRKAATYLSILVNNCEPQELETGVFGEPTKMRMIRQCRGIYATNVDISIENLYRLFKDSLQEGRVSNVITYDQILFIAYLMGKQGLFDSFKHNLIHTIVDEFQDTNALQVAITHQLAGNHLTVIGDVDQSIYGFRGGRPDLMEAIAREAIVINLPTNYRSFQEILDMGNRVIAENQQGSETRQPMVAGRTEGQFAGIKWLRPSNDSVEADAIITYIRALQSQGVPLNEMAILSRSRTALPILNQKLQMAGIPLNDTTRQADFLNSETVVDLTNFLKILTNPKDIYAFYGTLDRPKRGIGAKSLEKMEAQAEIHGLTMVEYVLSDHIDELTNALQTKVKEYRQVYLDLLAHDRELSLTQAVDLIVQDTGYARWAAGLKNHDEVEARIVKFELLAQEFETQYLANNPDATLFDQCSAFLFELANSARIEDEEGLTLATIHGAKGLEWRFVFLIGMEEGIFPMFIQNQQDEEEERRLLYVAITRARDGLILTSCGRRVALQPGADGPGTLKPTRFLKSVYDLRHDGDHL